MAGLLEAESAYLRDVLGVESILWPVSIAPVEPHWVVSEGSGDLGFILVILPQQRSDQLQLLRKIYAALNYGDQDVHIWQWPESKYVPAPITWPEHLKTLVVLGSSTAAAVKYDINRFLFGSNSNVDVPLGEIAAKGEKKVLITHGLYELLQNPDLKKATWQHLKALKR